MVKISSNLSNIKTFGRIFGTIKLNIIANGYFWKNQIANLDLYIAFKYTILYFVKAPGCLVFQQSFGCAYVREHVLKIA